MFLHESPCMHDKALNTKEDDTALSTQMYERSQFPPRPCVFSSLLLHQTLISGAELMHEVDDNALLRSAYGGVGLALIVVLSLIPLVGVFVAVYSIVLSLHFLKTAVTVKGNVLRVPNPFQRMVGPFPHAPGSYTNQYIKISASNRTTIDSLIAINSGSEASRVLAARMSQTQQLGEGSIMIYTDNFAQYYCGLRDLYLDAVFGVTLGFCCMLSIVLSILITSKAL